LAWSYATAKLVAVVSVGISLSGENRFGAMISTIDTLHNHIADDR
jgi:hypothetical protein